MEYLTRYYKTLENFYKKLDLTTFNITEERINELKEQSININKVFNNEKMGTKLNRYIRIVEKIHSNNRTNSNYNPNLRTYNKNSVYYPTFTYDEKYLLFMFAIDPNLEAAIISLSSNRTSEIKSQMVQKFGVFDIKLIRIEQHYIKYMLDSEKRNEINEEVEKRVFK